MKQTIFTSQRHCGSDAQKSTSQRSLGVLALALTLFTTLLVACQPIRPIPTDADGAASSATATDSEAIEIVQRYLAALNATVKEPTKIDEVMSFLAPDAIFINPTGNYSTLDEIRASLAAGAADGIFFETTNFRERGGRVVYDYQVKIGESLLDSGTDGLTIVKDGKIIFDGTERTEPK